MSTEIETEQPLSSVTITEYEPAAKSDTSSVSAPFDQSYV